MTPVAPSAADQVLPPANAPVERATHERYAAAAREWKPTHHIDAHAHSPPSLNPFNQPVTDNMPHTPLLLQFTAFLQRVNTRTSAQCLALSTCNGKKVIPFNQTGGGVRRSGRCAGHISTVSEHRCSILFGVPRRGD